MTNSKNSELSKFEPIGAVISCPHCKAQFLPAEVFLPYDHIGKSKTVVRDPLGKILYADYIDDFLPDASEDFTCEYCGKTFTVETTSSFKSVAKEESLDFDSESSSII